MRLEGQHSYAIQADGTERCIFCGLLMRFHGDGMVRQHYVEGDWRTLLHRPGCPASARPRRSARQCSYNGCWHDRVHGKLYCLHHVQFTAERTRMCRRAS